MDGVLDNLPVDEVKKLDIDKTIAVKFDLRNKQKYNTMNNIAMHAVDLMIEKQEEESSKLSDFVLSIDLKDVKVFSINKINFCYEQGYNQTLQKISKIKKEFNV